MKYIIVLCAIVSFAVVGCSGGEENKQDDTGNVTAAPPTNRIDIPSSVRQNLGITFATVEKRNIAQTITVPGQFELTPQARQEYRATLSGKVDYQVNQFDRVEAGDVLYHLHSPQWPELQREISDALFAIESAQSKVAVADAVVNETTSLLDLLQQRVTALAEVAVRRAELEQELAELKVTLPRQRAELTAGRSGLDAARRQFEHTISRAAAVSNQSVAMLLENVTTDSGEQPRWQALDSIEFAATTSGIVESIGLTPGGWVDTGVNIITVVNPDDVRFRAMGLQADLPRINSNKPCRIVSASNHIQNSIQPIGASLIIGLDADPQRRTVTLIANLKESADWARPGISAFLEITTNDAGGEVLAVPRSAVIQDGLVHVIFRRDPADPNKVIRLEADLGQSDGRWIEIQSGVKVGDEVVLDGVYELKLASSGSAQKGGHFHADGTFHAED